MLQLDGITKRYPGVTALQDVSFDLNPGEIHVLFGENGAGKSTLINVAVGNAVPDDGCYRIDGQELHNLTPAKTRQLGVAAVFQEFSLAPSLSVLDNIWLGRELTRFGRLDRARMRRMAEQQLAHTGIILPLDAVVGTLSRALKQQVEITKALMQQPRYLIFDEPTASLTDVEANRVLELIKDLRRNGVGIIYISHRMREICELADRITVLRSGRYVGTLPPEEITEDRLVTMMTGRAPTELYPAMPHEPKQEVLRIKGLRTQSGGVKDVSINVRAGEIVGLAGLVGCGKGRIGRACFGLEPIAAGEILLNGMPLRDPTPARMLAAGMCYFPSDRATEGLCLSRTIAENMTMSDLDQPGLTASGLVDLTEERRRTTIAAERLSLSTRNLETKVEMLSGGNRQKVLLARGLSRKFELFIFDEPTVGVDVGARAEIYQLMQGIAASGAAILVISSDLEEVVHLSHRVYAVHGGEIVAELQSEEKTPEQVLACFFGKNSLQAGLVA